MATKQRQTTKQDDRDRRPSSTSPRGGRTHEATSPPGRGDVDRQALEKSRAGLELAGGGH